MVNLKRYGVVSLSDFSRIISPRSSIMVPIYFSPTATQQYSTNLTIYSDATSGTATANVSGSGVSNSPTVIPSIGTYGACASSGTDPNCSPSAPISTGSINARIVSINTSTQQIVFEIKKCDGTNFSYSGNFFITSGLTCFNGYTNYGSISFNAGSNTVQVTITDNSMSGSKYYYPMILQSTTINEAPKIYVSY